ncbi:MAG: hypothetical protein IPH08_10500 [Rhodocyclaceae bacterium]|nr:hypothetical protein [Rhodocyclaceae bacterium]
MSDHMRHEMAQLFKSFFPEHAERWEYLLQRDQRKWQKMAPFKYWFSRDQTACSPKSFDLAHPLLAGKLEASVVALSCMWTDCWLKEMSLDEAYHSVHEGYISITPGQLGMAFNHEGGCWLLHK